MEYIKISAKTEKDAVIEAAIKLGTSSDNIEYEVLEKEKSGFLGIGSRPALIRAKIRETVKDTADTEAEKLVKEVKEQTVTVEEEVPEVKAVEEPVKENVKEIVKEAEPQKVEAVEVKEEEPEIEPELPKKEKKAVDTKEAEETAVAFLKSVFATMDMEVKITANCDGDSLNIDIEGEDMGILIGKRGQTLDSLQYLVSLVVNKKKSSYIRVKLDTENYRNRRKATLENLAKNIAFKVKKTRKPVFLEPMNPYERRIIHSALQNDPYVTTHSEGEEPCRKVVVTLKK